MARKLTKLRRELDLQRDYEQAQRALEEKRPKGYDYKIFSENGSQAGTIEYRPQDDILTINVTGESGIKGPEGSVALKGEYIGSVYRALSDLLSETEE